MLEKTCTTCKIGKSIERFSPGNHRCKDCRKIDTLKRKDKIKVQKKRYYEQNKDFVKQQVKIYHNSLDKSILRARVNKYVNNRLKTDILFNLIYRLRHRIRTSMEVKRFNKQNTTKAIIGCSLEFLKEYLMNTWINRYGDKELIWKETHIDHIKPLSLAKSEEELYELCHYTNLQLLTKLDNLKKSNKFDDLTGDKILPENRRYYKNP